MDIVNFYWEPTGNSVKELNFPESGNWGNQLGMTVSTEVSPRDSITCRFLQHLKQGLPYQTLWIPGLGTWEHCVSESTRTRFPGTETRWLNACCRFTFPNCLSNDL